MRAVQVHSLHIRIMLIFALAFFFVSTALVSDSSAIELVTDPQIYWAGNSAFSATGWNCFDTQHTCPTYIAGWTTHYDQHYGTNVGGFYLQLPAMTYEAGDWIVVQFTMNNTRSTQANHSQWRGVYGLRTSSIIIDVVDTSFEQLNDNNQLVTLYLKTVGSFTVSNSSNDWRFKFDGIDGTWLQLLAPSGSTSGVNINMIGLTLFHQATSTDYSSSINAINNKLGTTNSKLDSVNGNLNDLKSLQEQANDDANDRYEDEKDTINQNGDDAVDSWDDAQSNLSFQAPTFLFGWLWSLGSVEDCVDISVLASIIHSPETQYCTWYPTSIRSIVSPIINIFLVCLISGFVFSWLKKGGV